MKRAVWRSRPWVIVVAWCCACTGALAQKADSGVVVGESARVWSAVLQEQRRLLIYLPEGYARSTERYPVLYLMDAETQFKHSAGIVEFLARNERMPNTIVVGITNTQRVIDLSPTAPAKKMEGVSRAGGGDAFLKFVIEELIPWVEARYRTQPYRMISGHSFGGLMTVHALLKYPDVFQGYIAVSPSLWWDDKATLLRAKAELPRMAAGRRYLYLTWGDYENSILTTTNELVDWLKAHPTPAVQWASHHYPGDDHGTTPHRSLYDGLEALFAGWSLPYYTNKYYVTGVMQDAYEEYDLAAVEAHYAKLSNKYGYAIRPSASSLIAVARTLKKRKQPAAAIEVLRRGVKEYPWLVAPRRELAAALERAGCLQQALAAYSDSVRVEVEQETPYWDPVTEYRENVARVRRDMAARPSATAASEVLGCN